MKIVVSLVFFVLFGCTGERPDIGNVPSDFVYRSFPLDGNYGELRISDALDSVSMGDIKSRLHDCSSESLKYCVSGDIFTFAIPHETMNKVGEWEVGNTAFVHEGVSDESLLGLRLRIHTIIAESGNSEARFYFSELHGLVAVGSGIGNTIFVNLESCGLWAASGCR